MVEDITRIESTCVIIPTLQTFVDNIITYPFYSIHSVYKARYANITMYEIVFMTMKLIYGSFNNAMIVIFNQISFMTQLMGSLNTFLAYCVLWTFVWRFWCISYSSSNHFRPAQIKNTKTCVDLIVLV